MVSVIGCTAENSTHSTEPQRQSPLAEKLSPTATPYSKSPEEMLFEKIETAIVFVTTPTTLATGFLVSEKGLIITAAHVVEGYDRVEISPNLSGVTINAEVIYSNKKTDLATLFAPIAVKTFLAIEESEDIGSVLSELSAHQKIRST